MPSGALCVGWGGVAWGDQAADTATRALQDCALLLLALLLQQHCAVW
jgi:hypothetical protein